MNWLKKKLTDSAVICLVAAVAMLVALFLPYAAARAEFRQVIEALPKDACIGGTKITLHSTLRVSAVEFLKIYASSPATAAVLKNCGVLVGLMGACAVLGGVFALLKKAVPMLFCNVLSFAAFYLHNSNYSGRGLIPSWEYRYGIGYYLFFVAVIVAIAGGIWMLRDHKKSPPTGKNQSEPQE